MQSVLVRPQTAIFNPSSSINAANADELHSQLVKALASEQTSALLVNMGNVEAIDSAGLMTLVSAFNLAQNSQKRFALCSLSTPVRIVLELTQLDCVFEMFDDLSDFEK